MYQAITQQGTHSAECKETNNTVEGQVQASKELLQQVHCHLFIEFIWTTTPMAILDSDGHYELPGMLCHANSFKKIICVRSLHRDIWRPPTRLLVDFIHVVILFLNMPYIMSCKRQC